MTNENHVTDKMRDLILSYIEACNSNDKVKEEKLLLAIKQQSKKTSD